MVSAAGQATGPDRGGPGGLRSPRERASRDEPCDLDVDLQDLNLDDGHSGQVWRVRGSLSADNARIVSEQSGLGAVGAAQLVQHP
jgi:hypothetical protein